MIQEFLDSIHGVTAERDAAERKAQLAVRELEQALHAARARAFNARYTVRSVVRMWITSHGAELRAIRGERTQAYMANRSQGRVPQSIFSQIERGDLGKLSETVVLDALRVYKELDDARSDRREGRGVGTEGSTAGSTSHDATGP